MLPSGFRHSAGKFQDDKKNLRSYECSLEQTDLTSSLIEITNKMRPCSRIYYSNEAAITVFELLTMSGVSLETCRAIKKHWNNKLFRRIYGPKYEDGEWKRRTNRELEEMSKGENIVKWIKGQRISWLGHLEIMEEDRNWKGRDEEEDPGKDGEKKWKEIFRCWE